jgi:hypothetical protein
MTWMVPLSSWASEYWHETASSRARVKLQSFTEKCLIASRMFWVSQGRRQRALLIRVPFRADDGTDTTPLMIQMDALYLCQVEKPSTIRADMIAAKRRDHHSSAPFNRAQYPTGCLTGSP